MARESVTLHDSKPTVVIHPSYPIPSLQVKYSSMLLFLEKDNRITTGTTLQQESFNNSHLRSPVLTSTGRSSKLTTLISPPTRSYLTRKHYFRQTRRVSTSFLSSILPFSTSIFNYYPIPSYPNILNLNRSPWPWRLTEESFLLRRSHPRCIPLHSCLPTCSRAYPSSLNPTRIMNVSI